MQPVGIGRLSKETWNILEPWEDRLDRGIALLESELVGIRRHLHAHPEPSGRELETSKFLIDRLRDAGLTPALYRNGVGVTVDLEIGRPPAGSPLIAIRADMDALRLSDEKQVDYASRIPGIAHACGHDAHTTIALGAALAGSALNSDDGDGLAESGHGIRLRLLFQPAEETSEGAEWLVEQGALNGVDAILGLHVDPERSAGQVGIRYGVLTAHCDEVEILVHGRGGHAARPHHSLDPLAVSVQLASALYQFLPRTVDSRNPSVFTIGRFSGGYAANVIPERVEILGTLRTTDTATRESLKQRIQEICGGIEQSFGATVQVRFYSPLSGVDNHPTITAILEEACGRVVGSQNVALIDRPSMGGEDFSVYLDRVPGAMMRLGCAAPGVSAPFLHSPLFDIDERILALGTRILLRAALLLSIHWQSPFVEV